MKTDLTKKIEQALIQKYRSGTFKTHYGALEVFVDYSLKMCGKHPNLLG